MGKFKYRDPVEKGYIKFKLTKMQHNEIFKNRKITWADKYEYYYNEKSIILHRLTNYKAVLLCTLMFPIIILFDGLSNVKEACVDLLELYKQKKSGSFVIEHVYKHEKRYALVMEVIKNK